MKLNIKNMVCIRCKMVVRMALENMGLTHSMIELGEVEIKETLTTEQYNQLKASLHMYGLELIEDKRGILIEKIKKAIIEWVHFPEDQPRENFSEYISKRVNRDYTYLANIFSENENNTIEQHIIAHRIERAKELLAYNELNLTEIAYKLQYSSVAHLSNQFKKVTGVRPSLFKQLRYKKRIELENV